MQVSRACGSGMLIRRLGGDTACRRALTGRQTPQRRRESTVMLARVYRGETSSHDARKVTKGQAWL
jgi:hypothetical protein